MFTTLDSGHLAAIVFWSSLGLSSLAALLGFVRGSSKALIWSAILSGPFAIYLSLHPWTRWFLAIPVLHILSAIAVHRNKKFLAGLSLAGVMVFICVFVNILLG